ncbi:MAG TPA: TonB-dependent receptor [Thermoanaerobaculia bacterium]|nr:TonB-dependent receptor [Thermoanaerobaculia bacterium]
MTVANEPAAAAPRAILQELLAPHRLGLRQGPAGILIVVRREPAAQSPAEATARPLPAAPVFREEVLVTPSRTTLLDRDNPSLVTLSSEEIRGLPHLGDDLFRALSLLPGTTSNDVSAAFNVRGARRDETQVVLDGQELFEVFHLKDFDDALSVVAPATLEGAELMTGGFPVSYGDRMSGVLDLRTAVTGGPPRFRLGVAILGLSAGARGSLPGDRGGWIAELRRGSLDLVGRLLDREDPNYWDGFGKLDLRLGETQTLTASALQAKDELEFQETVDGEAKTYRTDYLTSQAWLRLLSVLSSDLVVESAASLARIERDRRGEEDEEGVAFDIVDQRDTDIVELRQSWHWAASPLHSLEWGWRWRAFSSDFDYFGVREFDDPLAAVRPDGGSGETIFTGGFEEEQPGIYLTDALRPTERTSLELGARWDRYTQTDESRLSPRLNFAWRPDPRGVLRLAWGRFDQSQRPYELEVENGETALHPVERAEHRILGYERSLPLGDRELALRAELYERRVSSPRPRWDNLFEPLNAFPEVEPAVVLFAPDRSRARGAELLVRSDRRHRWRWWASYVWSETEDRIDGDWIPRIFDQTHAFTLDVDVDLTEHWRLAAAWRFHTGWPTTALAVEESIDDEGEVEFLPVLGPLNAERLPDYHRLDLRASRRWRRGRALVDLFLEVQNVYDRKNVSGYDIEIDGETGETSRATERWPGTALSAGVSVEF